MTTVGGEACRCRADRATSRRELSRRCRSGSHRAPSPLLQVVTCAFCIGLLRKWRLPHTVKGALRQDLKISLGLRAAQRPWKRTPGSSGAS